MQTTSTCLIQQQLSEVEAAASSNTQLTSFFKLLYQTLQNLLDNPFNENRRVLQKRSDHWNLFNIQETKQFLAFLGYNEEDDKFVHTTTDENVSKLERCFRLLDTRLKQLCDQSSNTHFEQNFDGKVVSEVYSYSVATEEAQRLVVPSEQAAVNKTRSSGRVKELLLSRHLRKEQSSVMNDLGGNKISKSRSSDYAFSTNGYFHQSCSQRDNRRHRGNIRELFHQQDCEMKIWGSSNFNVKLA